MRATDVMTAPAVVVAPDAPVEEIARLLLKRGISAVPVAGSDGRLEGIVSEGDLVRRVELGTELHPSWWLVAFANEDAIAHDYAKSRGRRAADVMTREVVTVNEEAGLAEIAVLLERHRIKRVPVVRDQRVIGIVSRADLIRGLASLPVAAPGPRVAERTLRKRVDAEIRQAGVDPTFIRIVVSGDEVHLWGAVPSAQQLESARIAAESVGAGKVHSHLAVRALPHG